MTLPKVSITSYMEFPKYITNINNTNPTATSCDITSSTFTCPSVPDYLILYVKKMNYMYTSHENDYKFPISKVSIQFDNMVGICSTLTPEQLYQISYENGLKLDWNTYKGKVSSKGGTRSTIKTVGGACVSNLVRIFPYKLDKHLEFLEIQFISKPNMRQPNSISNRK